MVDNKLIEFKLEQIRDAIIEIGPAVGRMASALDEIQMTLDDRLGEISKAIKTK